MAARDIISSCQANIARFPNDCAAFVRAVADDAKVVGIVGNANSIVSMLGAGRLLSSGLQARAAAAAGDLVIGGVAAAGHGHVVVVVDGPMRGPHPYAFWGQYTGLRLGNEAVNVGFTRGHGTVNYAWKQSDLHRVRYAAFKPIESLMRKAGGNEGFFIPIFG